jgi:hypothetical protein
MVTSECDIEKFAKTEKNIRKLETKNNHESHFTLCTTYGSDNLYELTEKKSKTSYNCTKHTK